MATAVGGRAGSDATWSSTSSKKLEKAIRNGRHLRAVVQPYDAFVTRTAFPDFPAE